jgi:hypothetical protein
MSGVTFKSPVDLDEREYNHLSFSLPTRPSPILYRTTYMVQRNE